MPAIDQNETANSLFGAMKKSGSSKEKKLETSKDTHLSHIQRTELAYPETSKLPKFATLEKVTALLTSAQKDALDDTARKIMRFRSQQPTKEERERITANTVLRALIDNFITNISSLEMKDIQNEDELRAWMQSIFK